METKVALGVVEGLKQQPIMLALIVMNIVIYAAIFYSIQNDRAHNNKLLEELIGRCVPLAGR